MVIPYRTQVRFLIPAAGLAAIPLARLFDAARIWRWAGFALLTAHILTPQYFPFPAIGGRPPWDLSVLVPNSAPGAVPFVPMVLAWILPARGVDGTTAGLHLVVGVGCLATAAGLAWARRGGRWRWWMPALGLALMVGAEARLVAPRQEILRRYPNFPDYLAGWADLDRRTLDRGMRIAYAGTNLPYYLMGPDFRNDVRYVNVDVHRGWLLHDYHRAAASLGQLPNWPDTRPGWDRIAPEFRAWLANLRSEGIELLVVARANPEEGRHNQADREGFPIERVWADAHPEVFVPLYSDRLFKLYGLMGTAKNTDGSTDSPAALH
jgi:hypothetical protein